MIAACARLPVLVIAAVLLVIPNGVLFLVPQSAARQIDLTPSDVASWSYGRGWTDATQAMHPPALAGSMMTFAARDEVFLLFGGSTGEATNQTWIFEPITRQWTELKPTVSPSARADAMLTYDAGADAILLFGGWYETSDGAYHRLSDTWAFFVGNATWIERSPRASPSPRSDAAVAYDETDGVTLLFGGFDGANYLGDMWYYAFGNNSWFPRTSPIMPSARADGRMVYDSEHGVFFLFSGNDYSDANFNFHHPADMWRYSWSANSWTEVFPDVLPGPRDYAVFATDRRFGELLLTGGFGNRTILGDTWAFNTTRLVWRNITTTGGPSARMAAAGGYDSHDGVLVVFGGGDKGEVKADTWIFRYPPPILGGIFVSSPEPTVGQPITFTSSVEGGSGWFARLTWDFGDGNQATGPSTSHTYGGPGIFSVRFEAEDERGNQVVMTMSLPVGIVMPFWLDISLIILGLALVSTLILLWIRRRRASRPRAGVE